MDPEKTKLTGYDWYKSIGSPKYICAPMVNQSELAFRMLTRKYGCDLAYTPMFHARLFATSHKYREQQFSTAPGDEPVIVQFCGDDPEMILQAAKHVEKDCCAVDLNLGCPQGIAKKGHYGSYLLKETDLIERIVETLANELSIPVTVKIRKVGENLEETLHLCDVIQAAGASALTVHGRTKEQKGPLTGLVDWETCRIIKERMKIPVFVNGGIESFADVQECFRVTGCDAVMSSEALLESPCLFANVTIPQDQLVLEYLDMVEKYGCNQKIVKEHLFRFLYAGFQFNTDVRAKLGSARRLEEMREVARDIAERRQKPDYTYPDKGWYRRYREPLGFEKGRTDGGLDNTGEKRSAPTVCNPTSTIPELMHASSSTDSGEGQTVQNTLPNDKARSGVLENETTAQNGMENVIPTDRQSAEADTTPDTSRTRMDLAEDDVREPPEKKIKALSLDETARPSNVSEGTKTDAIPESELEDNMKKLLDSIAVT